MKPGPVTYGSLAQASAAQPAAPYASGGQSFDQALQNALWADPSQQVLPPPANSPLHAPLSTSAASLPAKPAGDMKKATTTAQTAYGKQMAHKPAESEKMSDWQKYKDDQLLRNPGGRYYDTQGKVVAQPEGKSVSWLIGRDVSGVAGNIKNFFANIFRGSKIHYRDEKNQIRQGQQTGLLGTLGNFCRDMAGALSFGAYHPDTQQAIHGFKNRLVYAASKLKDAFVGDLINGVPTSVNHMAQNVILAGWRLAEVLPDAALGSFQAGRKLTTTIFDNGQVAVEYLTDIVPSGDAWLRVHASDLKKLTPPVIYNLKMPEHFSGDTRWQYVRNTPFRKTIETIGSLVADGLTIGFLGQSGGSSSRRNPLEY
jgi:hypothetical protein